MLAVVIFGIFLLLREDPELNQKSTAVAIGVLTAISLLLQVGVGWIIFLTTGAYFLIKRSRAFWSFGGTAGALLLGGAVFQARLQGGYWKPFYFNPEYYLFEGGWWFLHPELAGLSAAKIAERCAFLGISSAEQVRLLASFEAIQKGYEKWWEYMASHWVTYDALVFTPIFLAGVGQMIRGALKKQSSGLVALWALSTVVLLYGFVLCSRTERGWSYGNRHMIAVIPIVTYFGALAAESPARMGIFRFYFWVNLGMMIPGCIDPWLIPNKTFATMSLVLNGAGGLVYLCLDRSRRLLKIAEATDLFLSKWPWAGIGISVFVAILQAKLFFMDAAAYREIGRLMNYFTR